MVGTIPQVKVPSGSTLVSNVDYLSPNMVDKASSCENPPEGLSGMRHWLDQPVYLDVSESTATLGFEAAFIAARIWQ